MSEGHNILGKGKHSFSFLFLAQSHKDIYITVATEESQLMYDSNPAALCKYHDGLLEHYYTLITCNQPIRGQFVQLQLKDLINSVMNLYEVEAHGI